MIRTAIIIGLVALCSTPASAASLILSPRSQTTQQTCTITLNARDLVNVKGLDIEVIFDKDVIACSSAQFIKSSLPGFSEFYRKIDNGAGFLEAVLLKQAAGGYTGGADSFLVLAFEPVSNGTARIYIRKSQWNENPLLIDDAGSSIDATVDTATVIVGDEEPPVPLITVTRLHQNYPNPFNPNTTLRFDVPAQSPVNLKIFDVNGRLIRVLIDGKEYGIGSWERKWDGKNDKGAPVQSGVYLCVYEACGRRTSAKLVILR